MQFFWTLYASKYIKLARICRARFQKLKTFRTILKIYLLRFDFDLSLQIFVDRSDVRIQLSLSLVLSSLMRVQDLIIIALNLSDRAWRIFQLTLELLRRVSRFEANFRDSFKPLAVFCRSCSNECFQSPAYRGRAPSSGIDTDGEGKRRGIYVTNQILLFSRFSCSESVSQVSDCLYIPPLFRRARFIPPTIAAAIIVECILRTRIKALTMTSQLNAH